MLIVAIILLLQSGISYLVDGVPAYRSTPRLVRPLLFVMVTALQVMMMIWYLVERRRWHSRLSGLPTALACLIMVNLYAFLSHDSTSAPAFIMVIIAMASAHQLRPAAAWLVCGLMLLSYGAVTWQVENPLVAWRAASALGLVAIPVTYLIVINRRRQHELRARLVHRARTDLLTGLRGRSVVIAEGNAELSRGRGTALVLFDLDSFKELTDVLGQGAADRALRHYGEVLFHAAREGDVVARLGGDEFAVLLRGVSVEEAAEQAAQMCRVMRRSPFEVEPGEQVSLAGNMGVAQASSGTFDNLYHDADRMLQRSKEARHHPAVVQIAKDERRGRHVRTDPTIAGAATQPVEAEEPEPTPPTLSPVEFVAEAPASPGIRPVAPDGLAGASSPVRRIG